MVTDEMVREAVEVFMAGTSPEPWDTESATALVRQVLEAALSAAEPVAELQSIDARELDEAIQLLPSVMRPSLSKVIIAAIEEQRRIIAYFKRISRARQLAFEAATTPPAPSVAVKALQDHVLADFTHLTDAQALSGPYIVKRIKERFGSFALSAQVQDVAESAFQAIADERLRQIGKGYDAAHDDRHVAGEIISATWGASARLWDAQECAVSGDIAGYKKYLVQAAAQIVAEYGRVERAAAPAKQEG